MAKPEVMLRQFQSDQSSKWIPGRLVKTYAKLEEVSYRIYRKDASLESIHFHLEEGTCEGEVVPDLWDAGAYTDLAKYGEMHLYAHFTAQNGSKGEANGAASNSIPTSSPQLDDIGRSLPTVLPQDRKRKRDASAEIAMKQEDIRGSRDLPITLDNNSDEPSVSEQGPAAVQNDGKRSETADTIENRQRPQYNPSIHPALPATTTEESYHRDWKLAQSTAPDPNNPDVPVIKGNMKDLVQGHRNTIATCVLLSGSYGIDAPRPCDCCVRKGWEPEE
ncbi:hypothetical protein BDV96DRAFT_594163 [Lophiotrema nucula]|uniref:Uncharacterized protein n=1 Tax=Lophiotrema nucula TaxID=690887 RepID=A0A6A5ZT58_9PLEO|nr:hypothetical protein BDV96DRAFT_594163 [Lophiotrema nucula]